MVICHSGDWHVISQQAQLGHKGLPGVWGRVPSWNSRLALGGLGYKEDKTWNPRVTLDFALILTWRGAQQQGFGSKNRVRSWIPHSARAGHELQQNQFLSLSSYWGNILRLHIYTWCNSQVHWEASQPSSGSSTRNNSTIKNSYGSWIYPYNKWWQFFGFPNVKFISPNLFPILKANEKRGTYSKFYLTYYHLEWVRGFS